LRPWKALTRLSPREIGGEIGVRLFPLRAGLFFFLFTVLHAQSPLTSEEVRGREIYERGRSPSGQTIRAVMAGGNSVAGSVLPCSGCHGHDGFGKSEAGVTPSNITWDVLTKPYTVVRPDGRAHGPYTDRLVKRAFTAGLDSAGNTLNEAMPRFQLTLTDASDLVAYIRRLGQPVDAGLSDSAVRLGVILSPSAASAETGQAIRKTLIDSVARVNAAGGMFGRTIELTFQELPADAAQRADSVRDFLVRDPAFAVLCGNFTGAEAGIAAVLRDTGTPAIAAFADFPATGSPMNPYVFYLDGGASGEVAALADFAVGRFAGKNAVPAIVSYDDADSRELVLSLEARLSRAGFGKPLMSVTRRVPRSANLVFWLRSDVPEPPPGGGAQVTFLTPRSLAVDLSLMQIQGANAQVFTATSGTSTAQITPDSQPAIRRVWERANTSVAIVAEAIGRAGRGLTRFTLLEALESLDHWDGGFGAPISFGPARRIGTSDVRIMMLDARTNSLVPVE